MNQPEPATAVTEAQVVLIERLKGQAQILKHPTHIQDLNGSTDIEAVPLAVLDAELRKLKGLK